MPKGVEKGDLQNAGAGQNDSAAYLNNANSIYGGLAPELQSEAAHPSGYTPGQVAAQDTAAQQSAGGSQAATAGEGGLYAARTKNSGAAQSAIGAGTRDAGANLSRAAVGVQANDANLAEKKQAGAQQQLGGLYGENVKGSLGALDASNSALANAEKSSEWNNGLDNPWNKLLFQGAQSGANAVIGAVTGGG